MQRRHGLLLLRLVVLMMLLELCLLLRGLKLRRGLKLFLLLQLILCLLLLLVLLLLLLRLRKLRLPLDAAALQCDAGGDFLRRCAGGRAQSQGVVLATRLHMAVGGRGMLRVEQAIRRCVIEPCCT